MFSICSFVFVYYFTWTSTCDVLQALLYDQVDGWDSKAKG